MTLFMNVGMHDDDHYVLCVTYITISTLVVCSSNERKAFPKQLCDRPMWPPLSVAATKPWGRRRASSGTRAPGREPALVSG